VLVLQATGSGAGQVLEPARAAARMSGEAAGRSSSAGLSKLMVERSGADGGAERSAAFGPRMFRGMRVAIDYKLSVSSVSVCVTPNCAVRMPAETETHPGQKLTLSKGSTVGCAEP
jgi:hypothetical protein